MKLITLTINTRTVVYVLAATTAPESLDGFGTFTLESIDGTQFGVSSPNIRVVLIPQEHLSWQTTRYSSGLEGWATVAGRFDYFDPDYFPADELLWKRFTN